MRGGYRAARTRIAIDHAATELLASGKYNGRAGKATLMTTRGTTVRGGGEVPAHPIEDGLDEDDWAAGSTSHQVGDKVQLLAMTYRHQHRTNRVRHRGRRECGVISQSVGTLTRRSTRSSLRIGRGTRRSFAPAGENEETTIADLAVALTADRSRPVRSRAASGTRNTPPHGDRNESRTPNLSAREAFRGSER